MKNLIYILLFILIIPSGVIAASYKPIDSSHVGPSPFKTGASSSQTKTGRSSTSSAAVKHSATNSSATRTYVAKDGSIKLFGTVEIGRPVDTLPIWTDVLARNRQDPIFIADKYFNKTTTWNSLQEKVAKKPALQQLQIINEFWNKWKYKEDQANWGKADYWAIPAQFLRKSGDCEDYSIVKYFTLKELGFDPHKMRIVVLRDTLTGQAHAVLAVYLENDVYILDNLSSVVLSHKRLAHYLPQYSVNEFRRWQHILPSGNRK